jgi:hypothetical protein
MGKVCLSCGLAAPVIVPKPETDKLAPTCEECPTCPNCRKPMTDPKPVSAVNDDKPEPPAALC